MQRQTSSNKEFSYLGNSNIKRDGIEHSYTQHEVQEYVKCSQDPVYFAKHYMKVINIDHGLVAFEPYPYQENMLHHLQDNRFSIVLACRQSGKCLHPNTIVNISFLDSNSENIKIETLFEIFTSINNYKLKYIKAKNYVFGEQIHEDILFNSREAKETFNRFWRSSSYNSKKLWWNRLLGKSCEVDIAGTLSLSSAIDKDVCRKYSRKSIYGGCISYDDLYKGCYDSKNFANVSEFEEKMDIQSFNNDDGGKQSVLRKKAQSASEGVFRKNADSRTERQNFKFNEEIVEERGVSSENGAKIHRRCSKENIGEIFRSSAFGRTQIEYKRSNEYSRNEAAFIFGEKGEIFFGGTQTKTFGITDRERNHHRTRSKDIRFIKRKGEIRGTQTKNFESRKGTSKENFRVPSLPKSWEWPNDVSVSFQQLQKTEKFVESYEGFGFYVESDTGFEELYQTHKTIKFKQYKLKTTDGFELICADNHIVFDKFYNEIFVKDLTIGAKIQTKNGLSEVASVINLGNPIHMYDLGVNHDNHRFFSSNILSHNSITSIVYLLWTALFQPEQTIAILANKGAIAKEMLSRITLALENIPFFLQPGCRSLNKYSIEFSNHSKIVAAATSSSSIRGMSVSCVVPDTRVCIESNGSIYYTTLKKADSINKSELIDVKEDTFMNFKNNKKYYTVYKITNTINGKEYIGFHSTNDLDDGYLGSGKLIKRAVEKYGPEAFVKEYIEIFDNKEEAELLEKKLVDISYVERDDTYNQSIGGNVCILYGENNGFYGKSHSTETKQKISEANNGRIMTNEFKQLISKNSRSMWLHRDDLRKAMSERMKNRTVSDETREKLSRANKGKKLSDDAKKKISKSAKKRFEEYTTEEYEEWYNKTWTDNHKQKISESLKSKEHHWQDKINKNPSKIKKTAEKHKGMKRSKEAKEKMSVSAKKRGAHNKNKVYCYDPSTLKTKLCRVEDVPEGWIRGFVPKELKCKS